MFTVLHSRNDKVGDVAATYAPIAQTCPGSCPMLLSGGCYALGGNVGFQVRRIQRETDGMNGDTCAVLEGDEIADMAAHAPTGHSIRIHVSGDATTDFRASQLARGADVWVDKTGGKCWSYTHAWPEVLRTSWGQVSVLASCESLLQVRLARERGYAAAVVVEDFPNGPHMYTDDLTGEKVLPCPAQTQDGMTCVRCKVCWKADRLLALGITVGFKAHGATRKRTLTVLR